jgi:aubergine-like protein
MDDINEIQMALQAACKIRPPSIVVFLIGRDFQYKNVKRVCYDLELVSQGINARNFNRGLKLAVASNILRQLNSKLGGDLFQIQYAPELQKRVMIIGIDVCHSGKQSIVGVCASVNQQRSQFFSNKIIQKKNQELVSSQLKELIKKALNYFVERHGDLPEHFIIYRDGVGDGMRRQVLDKEISQLREAITETYNTAKTKPNITVLIVNKRIT